MPGTPYGQRLMNLPARNLEYVVHNYSEEFSACDKGGRQGFNRRWIAMAGMGRCSCLLMCALRRCSAHTRSLFVSGFLDLDRDFGRRVGGQRFDKLGGRFFPGDAGVLDP